MSFTSGLIVLMIIFFVSKESWPVISIDPKKFFLDLLWDPSRQQFNLLPMALGSLFVTLGAIIIALPIGFMTAVFYSNTRFRKFGRIIQTTIEILAGIPSVVFGFWGIVAIVPIIYKISPPGANLLAAAIVLSVMLIPTITLFISNAIKSAPVEWELGARGLGLDESQFVFNILIPGIKSQIFNSILIAVGRALGETMAVLMVSGNIIKVPLSVFDPIRTLTSNIALEMAYAMDHHRAALFSSGLFLLLIVSSLSVIANRKGRAFYA